MTQATFLFVTMLSKVVCSKTELIYMFYVLKQYVFVKHGCPQNDNVLKYVTLIFESDLDR